MSLAFLASSHVSLPVPNFHSLCCYPSLIRCSEAGGKARAPFLKRSMPSKAGAGAGGMTSDYEAGGALAAASVLWPGLKMPRHFRAMILPMWAHSPA